MVTIRLDLLFYLIGTSSLGYLTYMAVATQGDLAMCLSIAITAIGLVGTCLLHHVKEDS
jgi:hypothetical protein